MMNQFWQNDNNKEKLYVAAQTSEMQEKYHKGCEIIKEAYIKYQQDKKINKIEEYIKKVNEIEKLVPKGSQEKFSNGEMMKQFWQNNNKEKLYVAAQTSEMQEKYHKGCEIIKEAYIKYQQKQNNKKSTYMFDLCEEYNIDVGINNYIIEHTTYEEFNAKLNYLILNGFGLTDESGMLHEIFSMCSANMEAKYGISLENLIKEYYVSDERTPGV